MGHFQDHVGSFSTSNTTDPHPLCTDISFPHDRAADRSHLLLRSPSAGRAPPLNVVDYATSDKRFASAHTNKYNDSIVEYGISRTSSQKRVLGAHLVGGFTIDLIASLSRGLDA